MVGLNLLRQWRRYIALVLLVQVINLSIDLPDQLIYRRLSSIYGAENRAINEIESLLELIVEMGADQSDAFPEYDEPDVEDQKRGKVFVWRFEKLCFAGLIDPAKTYLVRSPQNYGAAIQLVFSPPPEASQV